MGQRECLHDPEELQKQPGLEVVHAQQYSELQVVADSFRHHADPAPKYYEEVKTDSSISTKENSRKQRRVWLWVTLSCTCLLVIAGAVVGGILGSKAARASTSGEAQKNEDGQDVTPTSSQGEAPSATGTGETRSLENIRQGSTLSATGWRKSNGAEILLFYQGPDDTARFSRYDSNRASFAMNDSYWDIPNRFTTEADETARLSGTMICPQTELFYISSGRLLGVNFNDKLTPSFGTDSINDMDITTGANSFSKVAVLGGYGVFYQKEDGQLGAFVPGLGEDGLAEDYAQSWPTGLTSPRTSFAAFSVARPSDDSNRVDAYVLYLDATSNINVLYIDSSSVWKVSQPGALREVDADTDIACLTMATTDAGASGTEVVLEEQSSETRCYFQRGGEVEEVMLRGTEWVRIERVPIS